MSIGRRARRVLLWCALTLGLWLGHAPLARAQDAGRLRGYVRDETGAVLRGVRVEVRGAAVRPTARLTGAAGEYAFDALPPATYRAT